VLQPPVRYAFCQIRQVCCLTSYAPCILPNLSADSYDKLAKNDRKPRSLPRLCCDLYSRLHCSRKLDPAVHTFLENEAGQAPSPNLKAGSAKGKAILAETGAGCIGVHSKTSLHYWPGTGNRNEPQYGVQVEESGVKVAMQGRRTATERTSIQ
jgi:hypothetical protein